MAHLVAPQNDARLHQGDIFRDVRVPVVTGIELRDDALIPKVELHSPSWVLVASQECDLEQDAAARATRDDPGREPSVRADKILRGVLIIPGWPEDQYIAGKYIDDLDTELNRGDRRRIRQHGDARRYYVASDELLELDPPEGLIFDMKLHSMVPARFGEEHWLDRRVATLDHPWKEHMSRAFVDFFGRVALPDE